MYVIGGENGGNLALIGTLKLAHQYYSSQIMTENCEKLIHNAYYMIKYPNRAIKTLVRKRKICSLKYRRDRIKPFLTPCVIAESLNISQLHNCIYNLTDLTW